MVNLKNIHKSYTLNKLEIKALTDVNLEIKGGEIFGIIGISGAGKSSLIRCINLLEKPNKGEVIINNVDITKLSKKDLQKTRRKMGMVFQHFNLISNYTIYQNVALPLKIDKKPKAYIDKKVNEILEFVGLQDKKDFYPDMLSGGQKQRVGIARALVNDPILLLCDEATSALDPTTTASILKLLKDINDKLKITIILITHEMEVIKSICNRVAIIEKGRILESDEVINVVISPTTKTSKEFFSLFNDNFKIIDNINKKGLIIKAIFVGDHVTKAFISNIVKSFNVEVSILQGNISEINETIVGGLIIEINGDKESINSALTYLEENNIICEVI